MMGPIKLSLGRLANKKDLQRGGKSDRLFFLAVTLVTLFGTLMVFSAGTAYAEARYSDGMYFIKKQALWLIIGFGIMYIASRIKPSIYQKFTPHIYGISLFLLVLVLVVGFVGNGAQRWIAIGPLTIQPSEIAKLAIIMMLAYYFSHFEERATERRKKKDILVFGTFLPCLIIFIPIVLVMLQKHLSCIIILGAIGLTLIFAAGIDPRYISAFCVLGVIGVTCLALFTDYTKDRITVWQDPEQYKLTGGWQTLQGLMAIGSGGLFGVGYGNSILKHCYVSEPANDMIFAILCEELGITGAAIAMLLFALLIWRGIVISKRAPDSYARLLCLGICIKMAVQVLLNIAVVTNTIPNTGISLPFFSYGGSSLIMMFFEMGIVLSVSRYAKIQK